MVDEELVLGEKASGGDWCLCGGRLGMGKALGKDAAKSLLTSLSRHSSLVLASI